MHIDLRDLYLFSLIAETKSLTRAAERNHLSLPAVSARVKDLEAQAAVRVLNRAPRGVALTPAGQTVLRHARTILGEIEHMMSELYGYGEAFRAASACLRTRPRLPSSCRRCSQAFSPPTRRLTWTCLNAPLPRSSAACWTA